MTDFNFKYPPIQPHKSVEKLNSLRFDPIAKLVELYERIDADLNNMMYDEDGELKNFSHVAYSNLTSVKQKVAADLMRYGYSRVTETEIVEQVVRRPLKIQLSSTDQEFQDELRKDREGDDISNS